MVNRYGDAGITYGAYIRQGEHNGHKLGQLLLYEICFSISINCTYICILFIYALTWLPCDGAYSQVARKVSVHNKIKLKTTTKKEIKRQTFCSFKFRGYSSTLALSCKHTTLEGRYQRSCRPNHCCCSWQQGRNATRSGLLVAGCNTSWEFLLLL